VTLVGFAEAGHPELEQPDVVVLPGPCGPQHGQHLLGVVPPAPVHLGELEQHFDFTREETGVERGIQGGKEIIILFIILSKIGFVWRLTACMRDKKTQIYPLHPFLLQTQQAVRDHVHGQVLVGQGHLQLVQ